MESSPALREVIERAGSMLERLLATVAVGVTIVDARRPDMPILYVNPGFTRLTGYSSTEAAGQSLGFLQGPHSDREEAARLTDALAARAPVTLTLLSYRRDGSSFYTEMRLAPIPDEDGQPAYFVGLFTDVTDRVRTEAELARAAALHASVFNVMAEGTMVIARNGTVLDVNPAALALLRVTREDLDGEWWSRLDVRNVDGSAVSSPDSPGSRAVRERRPIRGARLRVRRGDGVDRTVSMNYEPLDGDGEDELNGLVISFRDITDEQRRQEELQRFAALVATSDDFIGISDVEGHVEFINDAGRRLVGIDVAGDVSHLTIHDFFSDAAWQFNCDVIAPTIAREGRWQGESTIRHFVTGEEIPVQVSSFLVRHPETGEPWVRATIQRDLTEEKRVMADLVRSRERYQAQFRNLPVPTYLWERRDGDFVLQEYNAAAETLTGGAVASLIGVTASDMYGDQPSIRLAMERCFSTRASITQEMDYRLRSTGAVLHLVITYVAIAPELLLIHTVDITERVEFERQLQQLSERDDLTGLCNRRYFEQRLTDTLGERQSAVLLIDVDHFKFVNDSLGHNQGDDLLREVAEAMRLRLRDDDTLARLGGDEFAVLLPQADEARARAVAEHLLGAIRSQVTGVSVTASAGAAVFDPGAAITASDAVVAADIALYEAKRSGRDRVVLYSGQAGQSLTWLQRIRTAIAQEHLVLHGQRVISLRDQELAAAYELLVRMTDEQGQLIPPGSFLPTAEQFGVIRDIDRWVLEHGLQFAALGHHVSLNLSARSLADPELADRVAAALARTGVAPGLVTFEFTETAAVSSVEDARTLTLALREMGCHVALDDFGTGFGTFVLLKHLPVSALKIDMEFVRELSTSPADQRIVRAIVQIAAEAEVVTVAEGVEDAGALALLREYGVDYAQGYHIALPGPLPGL